jgi:hypothetical protein
MGAKAEISWRRRTEDGGRRDVYARRVGQEWRFFWRERRYDCWEAVAEPPLEDWLELLDAVRRRIQRRLARPEEEGRIKRRILERFPGTEV